jgi:hypothetical protein
MAIMFYDGSILVDDMHYAFNKEKFYLTTGKKRPVAWAEEIDKLPAHAERYRFVVIKDSKKYTVQYEWLDLWG